MRHTVLISITVICICFSQFASAQSDPNLLPQLDFRRIVQDAKAKVFPAVVFIKSLRESHEAGEKISQEISGSGVLISPEGEVLTNWHVVEKTTSLRCLLYDGRAVEAEVIGTDKSTDLALIKLKLKPGDESVPFAEFGDSTILKEGDFVMAMGAPWGLNRSVSIGIISCTKRYLPKISEYSLWLQTDAAINPGNSGGPLVNTQGQIIGINTRGMNFGDGMGFAIPGEIVEFLVGELRKSGEVAWSWTGIQLQPLRDFERDTYFDATNGVIVAETDPQSPARRAGLKPRDRIVSVNGQPTNALTAEDLPSVRRMLGLLTKHEPARFDIRRGDEKLIVEITPREKGKIEGKELDCPRWDFTVKEINQFDNEALYFYRKEGVFVYGLKYPGNASSSGIRDNDILLKIDGQDVTTLDDVKRIHKAAIDNVQNQHRIMFMMLRGGLMRQIVLDFSRDYEKD